MSTGRRLRLHEPIERPSLDRIEAAAEAQRGVVAHTPLVPFRRAALGLEPALLVKAESLQPIGSFKLRGVLTAVSRLSPAERAAGLSTVSAGNTAQALAWCGRHFGVPAFTLMPESAPAAKVEAVRALGGTPRLVPRDEVFAFLREARWDHEPYAFIHPWIDPDVLAGHGTLGLEIAEDRPDVATVLIPVGGGGLLAGTASALRARLPEIEVVAVEPAGCPALATALDLGRPATVECRTACDGIAVPYVTEEMFPLLRDLVDEVELVDEDTIFTAMRTLALDHKLVAEPSGAIAVAAALQRRKRGLCRGVEVAILSGGSVAPELLAHVLARSR